MDVKVEARPLVAGATLVESRLEIDTLDVVIVSPIVSRFSFAPVISVSGHSISSINPEKLLLGAVA